MLFVLFLSVAAFAALVDASNSCIFSVPLNLSACDEILVPAGKSFVSGPILLQSGQTLTLESGSTLTAWPASQRANWTALAPLETYPDIVRYAPFITASGDNVTIRGGGIINGNGKSWWAAGRAHELKNQRPRLLSLENCLNCSVSGVRLEYSAFWTFHIYKSDNAHIFDISVYNPIGAPNTDGLDIDSSQNVLVENIDVETSDDCVAIKSGRLIGNQFPSRNVTIRNSKFSLCAGLAVGSETAGGVFDIYFQSIALALTGNVVRIKAESHLGNTIDNITFDGIKSIGASIGIFFDVNYESKANLTVSPTVMGNVYISNVNSDALSAAKIECSALTPCLHIHLDNVEILSIEGWKCGNDFVNGTVMGSVHPKPCF